MESIEEKGGIAYVSNFTFFHNVFKKFCFFVNVLKWVYIEKQLSLEESKICCLRVLNAGIGFLKW